MSAMVSDAHENVQNGGESQDISPKFGNNSSYEGTGPSRRVLAPAQQLLCTSASATTYRAASWAASVVLWLSWECR
jgi:hypothetical protein